MQAIATPLQVRAIMTLIGRMRLAAQKDDIISGASGGRTESTRELTLLEAKALIKYLKAQDPQEKKAELMRRKIISMAHEMNWRVPGTTRVDMQSIDAWCAKFGYQHKKLNQYLYPELPALVTQFQNMYKQYLKAI